MVLTLLSSAIHLVDYTAKLALLVYLLGAPAFYFHLAALASAHIATNVHSLFALCRGAPRLPRGAAPALVLCFGALTPLVQVMHGCDAIAAWWLSQDTSGRRAFRLVPLDVIFEGLVFAVAALHIRVCLLLGLAEPPRNVFGLAPFMRSWISFESLLELVLVTSLVTVATALVLVDSTLSLKLSRDLYGWPDRRSGGCRRLSAFVGQFVLRGCEVASKTALFAVPAALLSPWFVVGYTAASYVAGVLLLLLPARPRQVHAWYPGAAALLAFPLVFANLPQFVDCPKHLSAAQSTASWVSALRAVELAVAVSAALAAILLEAEVDHGSLSEGHYFASAQAVLAWGKLYRRNAALGWFTCWLVHYLCMVVRWCVPASAPPAEPVLATAAVPRPPGGAGGAAREGCVDPKEFWPSAPSLAPLLLSAARERVPPAWSWGSLVSLPCGPSLRRAADRQLRVEDFDTIGLIGSGEFGKVYQVRLKHTQEIFAMKRLSKEFYAKKRMADKAIREIAMLNLARGHPFVVRLAYSIESPREWAIVMEYCSRGDLQQLLLAEGAPGLTLGRTLRTAAEVVLALEHLHARGIVFRDLKLENIVLDQDGHAKLTDFGLAKQHRGGRDAIAEAELAGGVYASFTKTFCGSYGYAAPEVNPRREVHGFAGDLYSLGVLLLMMLMGGEVYHDSREPPWERRLPPESPKDLREISGRLSFDFYWASHHLLLPAGATHRVEVDLHGVVVLAPAGGPRSTRRQPRPQRPPGSPRERDPDSFLPESLGSRPAGFPAQACSSCEASRRRWDLALDLVRLLTDELPENRGTVATIKQHGFFAEEIVDWRTVYPKSWLIERVKAKLLGGHDGAPAGFVEGLERMPVEEIVTLLDEPEVTVDILDEDMSQHQQAWHSGSAHIGRSPAAAGSRTPSGASPLLAPRQDLSWRAHYP